MAVLAVPDGECSLEVRNICTKPGDEGWFIAVDNHQGVAGDGRNGKASCLKPDLVFDLVNTRFSWSFLMPVVSKCGLFSRYREALHSKSSCPEEGRIFERNCAC